MKYIITGHKGLIGEFLKRRLDAEGHKCLLNIDQKEGFNVLDLLHRERELKEKADIMFHFAAQCKINEAIANPILPHKNNVEGIFQVLEFCRRNNIKKIVVASTSRVLSPEENPYTASKKYVEALTRAYYDCYDIEYIIIRPSTVYGPGYDETSRLMNNFIIAALKNEDLKIYGNEEKTLDFTYVEDFVEGVMKTLEGPWNKDYNISGEEEVKIIEVAEEIIRQTKSNSKIIFLPAERAQPQKVKIDVSEIKRLGYDPKIPIKKGIQLMVDWYGKNPDAIKKYVDKGAEFYNGNLILSAAMDLKK